MRDQADARRTFGPTVVAGIAGTGLAAVAGTKKWVTATDDALVGQSSLAVDASLGEMPAVAALALVALACWGVVLVTRGIVRRIVIGLALVVAAGMAVIAVFGLIDLHDSVPESLARAGVTGSIETSTGAWFWLALVGAILAVGAGIVGIRSAPAWPEMGRRYDAPTTAAVVNRPIEDQSNLDLWNAIGEGDDPTDQERRDG